MSLRARNYTAQMLAAWAEGWRNRPRGARRVWLLTVGLAAVAVALVAGPLHNLRPTTDVSLPWWTLAMLFGLTEVFVVHVHFRSEAHSVSLNEIPLVLGLFFVSPVALVVAQVVGAAAALVLHRRQANIKLAFNLAQLAVGAGVAALVFHYRMPNAERFDFAVWGASLGAAAAAALIAVATIAAAISLSEGRFMVHKWLPVGGFAMAGTVVNTSLALIAVTVLVKQPVAASLLIVPIGALVLAYRAYNLERQKHERIEFLYQASRILDRAPETQSAVLAMLSEALKMFRADLAEVVLLPGRGEETAVRSTLRRGDTVKVATGVELDAFEHALVPLVSEDRGVILVADPNDAGYGAIMAQRRIKDAMVAPLRAEQRLMGMLIIANRLGDVTTFNDDDLRLLETLAGQAAVAVENGRLEQSLKYQAFHDSLTSLANRTVFTERVKHALTRRDEHVAVLFIDLDDFKTVNDSLGHAAGDHLLVTVAERLKRCVRPSDTAARLGGDEFAILLEEIVDEMDATRVADRIVDTLRLPIVVNGEEILVYSSIGIATSFEREQTADALMRNADVAMYSAKAAGKRRYAVFQASMQAAVRERHALKADLERAVGRDEMVAHYQPIISLDTGGIVGVEALLRWNHPERGLVPPMAFVGLAEETGLIVDIGRWILREACRELRGWQLRHGRQVPLTVSVNLSGQQLRDPNFVDDVVGILRETGVDPRTLTLEVTESILLEDTRSAVGKLRELRGLGVRIAMDDFGTGYSSLSCLRDLPVDELKIDKSFVDSIKESSDTPPFLDAITRLGDALHLDIVAEGIEHFSQVEALRRLECTRGQGFSFARPMTPQDIDALLATRQVYAVAADTRDRVVALNA